MLPGRAGGPGGRAHRCTAARGRSCATRAHNRLLAVPAALYAVNNYLKFAMQLYFKPTTAKMLGNLKVRAGHSSISSFQVHKQHLPDLHMSTPLHFQYLHVANVLLGRKMHGTPFAPLFC